MLIWLSAATTFASDLAGRVVGVTDGDTVTLLAGTDQVKVRLAEIDAPESGQAFGHPSKQALADMVFGKDVLAVEQTKDRFGRPDLRSEPGRQRGDGSSRHGLGL